MLTRFSLILILSVSAFAQITGVRFDDIAYKQAGAGIATVGNPVVTVCTVGSTTANCALNKVLTYTDGTLATPCPSNAQVTLTQTSVCVATGDTQGNFGFWLPAGNYSYMIAGSGAATKMYTLTLGGNGAGGVTISGAVTPGHIATIVDSLTLQDGGSGGSGNSTTPVGSGQIAGASGTFLSNSIRYVNAADYMWTQSPSDDLSSAGANTITLSPCPAGVAGADTWNYVRLATQGTPEDVLITGGTCIAGGASGTITVTTANVHSAGYTVASSTQGWQEASNDARITPVNPTGSLQSGHVVGSPGEYVWTATMTVHAQNQTLDFSGTIIDCNMSASCLLIGSTSNAFTSQNTHVYNFRGRPMISSGTYAMMEDNGNASVFDGVYTRNGYSGGTFGYNVQIDNDQAASVSHVDPSLGSPNIRCDSTFCGAVIYGPGPFATNAGVLYLHDSNLTLNCASNGIEWKDGNTLHVSDTVIQGYSQFGIRTGTANGGFGDTQLDNVYEEAGNCTNHLGNIGQAGVIARGNTVIIRGGEGPVGNLPIFNTQGGSRRNYFVVAHSGTYGPSVPLPIGYGTPTSGTISLIWPQIAGASTYDVLATAGSPDANTSILPIVSVAGNYGVDGAIGISGSCSAGVCTATDTFATPLDSYTVAGVTYFPLLDFWPGSLILGTNADTNVSLNTAQVYLDKSLNVVSVDNVDPVVFAHNCPGNAQFNYLWQSCISGNSGPTAATQATVLNLSTITPALNTKGRLNFLSFNTRGIQDIITLSDSTPYATVADPRMRPLAAAADSAIGSDCSGCSGGVFNTQQQIAFRAPVALSNYINHLPDGSNWLERLTSSLKTFKVPIAIPTGTPASSSAACTTGTIEWDSSYVYVCVSTNAWERAGIATW